MKFMRYLMQKHTYPRKIIDLYKFVMHRTLKESLEHIERNGIKSLFDDTLFEMMQINDPGDFIGLGIDIQVYGLDRPSYTPHFHMRIKNSELEISIETLQILHIKGRKLKDISWDGFRKERKALEKWLLAPSKKIPSYTNYEALCIFWNAENPDNQVKNTQPTVQFVRYGLYPENQ